MTTSINQQEKILLSFVLLLGLVHGLIYVFGMPPWQYNEEPSHFEYAWLIASRLSLPEYPAYDQEKRREIAASMIEHKFFTKLGFVPDLNDSDEPIWIGTNVTGALPLYHMIAAIPMRLLLKAHVETQLYALRLLSLLMFEVVLVLAYLVVREMFPARHSLRWITPACIAMLPSFVHLMTSINNDAGATLMFSFFLWTAVRLIMRGFTPKRFLATSIATILCCLTKNTVIVALPLAVLAVWLSLIKSRWAVIFGILIAAGGMAALFAILAWGDAAFWYRASFQQATSRISTKETPYGDHAFLIEADTDGASQSTFRQLLPASSTDKLRGKKVTVGAWIWADTPIQGNLPAIFDGFNLHMQTAQLSQTPTFYWMTVPVPANAPRVEMRLVKSILPEGSQTVKVYYDGIFLVTGRWQVEKTPVFLSVKTKRGSWGEKKFINPVRNPSAESAWLYVRPWLEKLTRKIPWLAHLSLGELLASICDVAASRWLYIATTRKLMETFWAKFAWERISIPTVGYQILTTISVAGVIVSCSFFILRYKRIPFQLKMTLIWLGITTFVIVLMLLMRGFFGLYEVKTYVPVARYGFPAIIPLMLIFSYGWRKIFRWLGFTGSELFFAGFLILDIYSVYTWISYFSNL